MGEALPPPPDGLPLRFRQRAERAVSFLNCPFRAERLGWVVRQGNPYGVLRSLDEG
jgi:hypothetical protein